MKKITTILLLIICIFMSWCSSDKWIKDWIITKSWALMDSTQLNKTYNWLDLNQ